MKPDREIERNVEAAKLWGLAGVFPEQAYQRARISHDPRASSPESLPIT
jgi:hypothetical protein